MTAPQLQSDSPEIRDDSASFAAGLSLILVLALGLRAYDLQGQSLSSDEIIEASIARLSAEQIAFYPDGFPPLYHLLLAGWMKLWPAPEAGRWLSVFVGVATVYAVGRWARESVSPTAGLIAAALAAISPLHVYLSQEMRAYALYICLACFAMRYFFRALRLNDVKSWFALSATMALAVNTHYYAAMLAALLGLLLIVYRAPWAEMRRGLGSFLAVGVLSVPALALLPGDVAYQSDGFAAKAPVLATLGHTAYAFFAGYSLGPSLSELHVATLRETVAVAGSWVAVFAVTGGWLLWLGVVELRRRPHGWGIIFLALASAPIIGLAGSLAGVGPKVRYWSWILMPLVVWLAAGAAHGWNGRRRWLTRLALAALVALQLLAVANRYDNPRYANEDVRSAAAYLEVHSSKETPIFVVADYMAPPVRYYLNGEHTLNRWLPHDQSREPPAAGDAVSERPHNKWLIHPRSEEDVRGSAPFDDESIRAWLDAVRSLAAADGEFWLLYSRPFHGDRDGSLLRRLRDDGWIQLEREFPGATLYRGRIPAKK